MYICYMATSQDGFIADENGKVDWIPHFQNDLGYKDFYKSVDYIVMGSRSYFQQFEFDKKWSHKDKETIVLTSQTISLPEKSIKLFSGDVLDLDKRLGQTKDKKIWIFGGAKVVKEYIDSDLDITFEIYDLPIKIGKGIALFDDNELKKLKLVSETKLNDNVIKKTYVKIKNPKVNAKPIN